MADIETSVAITAQTDDLQSGMQTAANSVETATEAMKAQFSGLGAAAQQAQSQITGAVAQIGVTIGALQTKAATLAGSASGGIGPIAAAARGQGRGISVIQANGVSQSGGGAQDRLPEWRAELQSQLSAEQAFFGDSKAEELAFWQNKLALTEAGSKEQLAVENSIFQLEKQLAVQNERDTLASLSADEKVTDAAYARKKAAIQDEAELGKISASQEVAQLKELLDSEWALQQDYYEKKLAAATGDARTQEKLTEEEEVAYQKYLADKQKLDTQAVLNSEKQWEALLQPIQRALDTSISELSWARQPYRKRCQTSRSRSSPNSSIPQYRVFSAASVSCSVRAWSGAGVPAAATIRIFRVALPAPARTSLEAGFLRGCSARAASSALSVWAAWFPVVEFSAASSRVSVRYSPSSMAGSSHPRKVDGWCRLPRWHCSTPMKWCCQRISAKASSR